MACRGYGDSGQHKPGKHGTCHKFSWRRLPLAPPEGHWAGDPQTGEQLCQRSPHTTVKVLGPKADFPSWGSSKGTEKPQVIWCWRPVRFDDGTSTGLENQTLWGHKQYLMYTRIQEKRAVSPQETKLDLSVSVQEPPGEARISSGLSWCRGHWIQHYYEPWWAGISLLKGSHNGNYHLHPLFNTRSLEEKLWPT